MIIIEFITVLAAVALLSIPLGWLMSQGWFWTWVLIGLMFLAALLIGPVRAMQPLPDTIPEGDVEWEGGSILDVGNVDWKTVDERPHAKLKLHYRWKEKYNYTPPPPDAWKEQRSPIGDWR